MRKFVRHSPIAKNVFLGSRVEALLDRLYERHSAQGADVEALRARRVVEAVISHGVSTLFLASALRDNWASLERPALELVAPHLRRGAVVICDNTQQCRDAYQEYVAFVEDPGNGLRTLTLPFDGRTRIHSENGLS